MGKFENEERFLRKATYEIAGYILQGYINESLDNNSELKVTNLDIEKEVYNELMCGKDKFVKCPISGETMEKKHIKFLGEEKIREMIEARTMKVFLEEKLFDNVI